MTETTHIELKAACTTLGISVRSWASTLQSPNKQEPGISHTAVNRVSKGENSTEWIQQEIIALIQKAKAENSGKFALAVEYLSS